MSPLSLAEKVISILGYPQSSHALFNHIAETSTLNIAPSTEISSGCILQGEITIGPESRVRQQCKLQGDIDIERRTGLEKENEIIGNINIGKYCAIAPKCIFRQKDHNINRPAMQGWFYNELVGGSLEHVSKGPITVRNDVWIGTRATILSGVEIGHGAVVGAGSVVTKDVEPYAVVAGNPARRVKWRFPKEVREKLLDISWWEWDDETIYAHREFFKQDIESVENIPNPE